MFLYIFTFTLIIANIYCFIKKKYIYLFFPCMLFLPTYYGIEINETLPLITVKRIMFIIFYIYVFINYRHNFDFEKVKKDFATGNHCKLINFIKNQPAVSCLCGYFLCRMISNLYYFPTLGTAKKTIFEILFEQLLLCVSAYLIRLSNDEIAKLIKAIVYSATFMFISGIFESLAGFRIWDSLYTVNRDLFNIHAYRLGLLRATTSFGIPTFYGNMCILILPLILYLQKTNTKKHYYLCISLCLFAVIHSGCRADILYFIAIIICYSLYCVFKINLRYLLKPLFLCLFSSGLLIILLASTSKELNYYYTGTTKSILNEFGFSYDLNKDAPSSSIGYGGNENGTLSRISQLSGIPYVLSQSPLFGFGAEAQNRNMIYYYINGQWKLYRTYDVGYVEIICDEGIVGVVGHFCLIFYAYFLYSKSKHKKSTSVNALFLTPFYLICLLSTANMYYFLFLYITLSTFSRPISYR